MLTIRSMIHTNNNDNDDDEKNKRKIFYITIYHLISFGSCNFPLSIENFNVSSYTEHPVAGMLNCHTHKKKSRDFGYRLTLNQSTDCLACTDCCRYNVKIYWKIFKYQLKILYLIHAYHYYWSLLDVHALHAYQFMLSIVVWMVNRLDQIEID